MKVRKIRDFLETLGKNLHLLACSGKKGVMHPKQLKEGKVVGPAVKILKSSTKFPLNRGLEQYDHEMKTRRSSRLWYGADKRCRV